MPFTPTQVKEYRKKIRLEGKCTRCHKKMMDEAQIGVICVNCLESTLNNKRLWRWEKQINGERYT